MARDDEHGLIASLGTLIADRRRCIEMGRAGRARAEKEFSLNRLLTETLEAYAAAGWRNN